jgi:addiction module HigA family antidote
MYQTRKPVHPGKVFLEDVLLPLDLSITKAADMLGVSRKTLSELVNEKSSLSPVMTFRIAKVTDTSPESWIAMQTKLSLWVARQSDLKNVKEFPKLGISA